MIVLISIITSIYFIFEKDEDSKIQVSISIMSDDPDTILLGYKLSYISQNNLTYREMINFTSKLYPGDIYYKRAEIPDRDIPLHLTFWRFYFF